MLFCNLTPLDGRFVNAIVYCQKFEFCEYITSFHIQTKKEEIWLSPMTKAPTPTEMSKGQWQHKQRHKKVRLNSGCGPT